MKAKLWKQRKIRDAFDAGAFSYDIRGGPRASHRTRLGRTPEWTKHDAEIQNLLLRVFPKLQTDPNQRTQAGTWARIIQLYYRVGSTTAVIAEEMGISKQCVQSRLYRIRRSAEGQRTDGKPRAARRGRPRQNYF